MWPVVQSPMEVHELLIQSPSIEVQVGDREKETKRNVSSFKKQVLYKVSLGFQK